MGARRWVPLLVLVVVPFLVLAPPGIVRNSYQLHMANMIGINIILALSLNVLYGFAGQVSFGHAAFYALGAYGAVLLQTRMGWHVLVSAPITLLAISSVAWLIGYPVLRLRGHFLGLATLALGLFIESAAMQWISLTGGPAGVLVPPPPALGINMQRYLYYIIAVAAAFTYALSWSLSRSWMGIGWRAIHGDEFAASAIGVDVPRYKAAAFALSGALAGLAGILYAYVNLFISPEAFGLRTSVQILTMVVLGGLGSVHGVTGSAIVLTLLPEWLVAFEDYHQLAYAIILLVALIYFPRGLGRIPGIWRWLPSPRTRAAEGS